MQCLHTHKQKMPHNLPFFVFTKFFFLFPTKTNQCRNITSSSLFISGVWSAVCEWVSEWVSMSAYRFWCGDCHSSLLTSAHRMRSITPIEQTCVQHGVKKHRNNFAKKCGKESYISNIFFKFVEMKKRKFCTWYSVCAMCACFHFNLVLHDFILGLRILHWSVWMGECRSLPLSLARCVSHRFEIRVLFSPRILQSSLPFFFHVIWFFFLLKISVWSHLCSTLIYITCL